MRSGFVAIVGRANVGKSTLMNRIVGEKVAGVSPKPQMTRHQIRGIAHLPDAQIAFVDTPGVHLSDRALNLHMVRQALAAVADSDVILLLLDASGLSGDDEVLLEAIAGARGEAVAAINKIDRVADKATLLPVIDTLQRLERFAAILPISARSGDGVEELVRELVARLPVGPALYPEEQLTDRSSRWFAAEIIREKIFGLLSQELPYGCAVTVEGWEEPAAPNRAVRVSATIHVERDSQKGMVIGKGGRQIKSIGQASREELERHIGRKVMLDLRVRVEPNWTKDEKLIRKLGHGDES